METNNDIQHILDRIKGHPNWPVILDRISLSVEEQVSRFASGCARPSEKMGELNRSFLDEHLHLDGNGRFVFTEGSLLFRIGVGDTRSTFLVTDGTDAYAVKIAMNKEGMLDNRAERTLFGTIDPSVRKHLARYLGGDDLVAVYELAAPLSALEFMKRRHDLHDILVKMGAVGTCVLDCFDPERPEQWGQVEGVPILLDYANYATSTTGDGYSLLVNEMLAALDEFPAPSPTPPHLEKVVRTLTHHPGWPLAVAMMHVDLYTQAQDLCLSGYDVADGLSDILDLPLLGNGSSRATFLVDGYAVKVPLNSDGRRHNLTERDIFRAADSSMRVHLSPALHCERDFAVYPVAKTMDEGLSEDMRFEIHEVLDLFSENGLFLFDCFDGNMSDQWGFLYGNLVLLDYADSQSVSKEDYQKCIRRLIRV